MVQRRVPLLILLILPLGSCSYEYELLAIAHGREVAFIVDPASHHHPSCLRLIEITAEDRAKPQPNAPDYGWSSDRGTFWFQTVSFDDACANRFPLIYGRRLNGRHQQDYSRLPAKPLRRNVVYQVATTTGATDFGNGRFIIRADGSIDNLPAFR